jgi:ribosomal protein L11 methyltransferase
VRVAVRGEAVPDDWSERWKRFHRPALIGDRLWVRPPWIEPRDGALDLVVDPGEAFGTGAHPTTRLTLELMLEIEPGGSFADLGCGSGVLAIAAARLGFAPVTAVDSERAALDATRRNAAANEVVLDQIERVNLREEPPPPADTLAANLTRPLLLCVAELLRERPRVLLVSGLLDAEADEVAAAFAPLAERRRRSASGWSALMLSR